MLRLAQKNKITEEQRDKATEQIIRLQKDISYDTRDYDIKYIIDKFKDKYFYIPDYQRHYVWDNVRKAKFIESVILGLPIPLMFFAITNRNIGSIEIIDGVQRMSTLVAFKEDKLELKGLKKLTELNGFRFSYLSKIQQSKFLNRTLRVIVLSEDTTAEFRQDIFGRINTGGLKANSIEIRRGVYEGPFMDFLEECSNDELFQELCPLSENLKNRHEGLELVLRFFAYLNNYKEFAHNVEEFLDKYVENNKDNFNKAEMEKEFKRMLNFVGEYFLYGFAKTKNAKSTPRVRFEAISVGVALALRENPELQPKSMDWLVSKEFEKHTTSHASNSRKRVRGRIEFVRNCLLEGEKE